ncbi:MAG TPA: hypothetical protein VK302_00905 [Terriglobales bacterium]|nr:hypothetical protein [Terriglobales bacterium]
MNLHRLVRASLSRIIGTAAVLSFALLTIILTPRPARANPAFARKYGMPCSNHDPTGTFCQHRQHSARTGSLQPGSVLEVSWS